MPDKPKVTIYDVAARAGVAISTVSRVLNDSQDVSDRTRERVLKTIEELQFRPDRTAKALAQKQTQVLAIALPTFTTPFHNELLKGVRFRLRGHHVDLLLYDLGSSSPDLELLNFLKRGAVDGLLLAGVPFNERVAKELQAWKSPVVLVGTHHPDFDSFYWDDETGSHMAVEHLIEQGHERIGMIRAHTTSDIQDGRVLGYRKALEDEGLPFTEDLVQSGTTEKHAGFSEEAGYEAMEELLKLDPPVTAVFASSDVQAIGAWKACRDAGKRVPQDVAIIGYDDIKTSQFIGLSSMAQSMHHVGEEAIETLLQRVKRTNKNEPPRQELIPSELMVRASSDFRCCD